MIGPGAPALAGEAWRALLGHRLRSGLSSAGVAAGVATVMTALAIGDGARRAALAEIGALGIDNLFIRAAEAPPAISSGGGAAPRLTTGDAAALAVLVPGVRTVAAVRSTRAQVDAPAGRTTVEIIGVTTSWAGVRAVRVARGRWLTDRDADARRRVAVLGADLAEALFGAADPTGRYLRAGGAWYLVVGVLDDLARPALGSGAAGAQDARRGLFVPLHAMDRSLGTGDAIDRVHEIVLRVAGGDAVAPAEAAAAAFLRRQHRGDAVWEIVSPRALLAARRRAQRTFDLVVLALGGLALLISGIGIMNVMLASVAERTVEIGVRRAVGASPRAILGQFAIEAGALCLAGGVAGVLAGAGLSAAVAALAGWPVHISPSSVAIALLLAAAVGLLFGIYPACRAARLDPVAAIRSE